MGFVGMVIFGVEEMGIVDLDVGGFGVEFFDDFFKEVICFLLLGVSDWFIIKIN